jgi:hypothetical protein
LIPLPTLLRIEVFATTRADTFLANVNANASASSGESTPPLLHFNLALKQDLARHRAAPKNGVKGEPGGADYLYGEITESTHGRQPGTLQSLALSHRKKSRAVLAELGLLL